jgi:hypothetical protein
LRSHAPKPSGLTGLDATAFTALRAMCEFRLGCGLGPDGGPLDLPPISLELLVDCLRELARSTVRHTKAEGRQGDLTFIDRFLP